MIKTLKDLKKYLNNELKSCNKSIVNTAPHNEWEDGYNQGIKANLQEILNLIKEGEEK